MQPTPEQIERTLDQVLLSVQKPARYVGGEFNSVAKDWESVAFRAAMAFPDIYDLGMSNLGWMILYGLINDQPDMFADRVFSPWSDMEEVMRREGLPLYGLESKHPLCDFDLLGISLPYEQLYTNVLNMLDLAGMPVRAAERDETYPVVIAGGHACYNPEPMADFIDAFAIGEGEEVMLDICRTLRDMRGQPRDAQLRALAGIDGVYVPRFYDVTYHDDGTVAGVAPNTPGVPKTVRKRIVPVLPKPFTRFLVPHVDTVHNRAPIEIMRGCTRGCRFCHAGMVTRPVRERPVEEVVAAAEEIVRNTGFEELGLLSLSSSDYTPVKDLVNAISRTFEGQNISVGLPSLRIESVSVDLMDALQNTRRSGFTFAPEAATENMRNRINKTVSDDQLLATAREVYSRGWVTIKLYFMIGHPSETLEDVQAIADLCMEVMAVGRKAIGRRASLHVGVSTFVPKPHTPFQWVACDAPEMIEAKIQLLRRALRSPGLKMNWTDPRETLLEAWLSRGDRRLGEVIWRAWQHGAKFDAWQDQFNFEAWQTAFEESGLNPADYTHRDRAEDEVFAWDHISPGVSKAYLLDEYHASLEGRLTSDCREQCYACGILPQFAAMRRQLPKSAWFCPGGDPAKA